MYIKKNEIGKGDDVAESGRKWMGCEMGKRERRGEGKQRKEGEIKEELCRWEGGGF